LSFDLTGVRRVPDNHGSLGKLVEFGEIGFCHLIERGKRSLTIEIALVFTSQAEN
jgi:hypothetical protein